MTVKIDPDKVETLAAQGLTVKQIADCVGCARSTLHERMKEGGPYYDSAISDAVKRGRSKGMAVITNALFQSAKGGNVTAQIFYLKNRAPDKWKDRRTNELTGKDGGNIKTEHILPFEFVKPAHEEPEGSA